VRCGPNSTRAASPWSAATAPYSLYDQDLVTFDEGAFAYDHRDAPGFIRLNALWAVHLGRRRKRLGL